MNQLPDYLPSCPPMYGVKQQANQHLQGASLTFTAVPKVEGASVDPENYTLKLTIKTDLNSEHAVWRGYLNYGMFIRNKQIVVNIPNTVTARLPSGVYYIAIDGRSKTDPNNVTELYSSTISINPSAASHYPITTVGEITAL